MPSLRLVNGQTEGSDSVTGADVDRFVGRWRRLISMTNWEKGKIISEWRTMLEASGANSQAYGDEAWARTVGGVTAQHVGRLRRVFDRFGRDHTSFEGLFWSHFHAALDWDDAEMWLEGAVQNHWSVSKMRRQRWETLGGDEPSAIDEVLSEIDEDLEIADAPPTDWDTVPASAEPGSGIEIVGDTAKRAQPVDEKAEEDVIVESEAAAATSMESDGPNTPVTPPFARVGNLPKDLQEALEAFKIAILHHKMQRWRDVSVESVLAAIDGLREMTLAK